MIIKIRYTVVPPIAMGCVTLNKIPIHPSPAMTIHISQSRHVKTLPVAALTICSLQPSGSISSSSGPQLARKLSMTSRVSSSSGSVSWESSVAGASSASSIRNSAR